MEVLTGLTEGQRSDPGIISKMGGGLLCVWAKNKGSGLGYILWIGSGLVLV